MAAVVGYMPFPEFFSIGNNYKYCSISGVFSVLEAPRKVLDTVLVFSTLGKWLIQFLNPLNHWEQLYNIRFPEFFNMVK